MTPEEYRAFMNDRRTIQNGVEVTQRRCASCRLYSLRAFEQSDCLCVRCEEAKRTGVTALERFEMQVKGTFVTPAPSTKKRRIRFTEE